jgi:hypothetical protein
MRSDFHLYLDLDRTLFDTPEFMERIMTIMATQIGGSMTAPNLLEEALSRYRILAAGQYTYQFFTHMAAYGFDQVKLEAFLREQLQGDDFLYPDAHGLLDYVDEQKIPVTILTFGDTLYQCFKASLVDRLKNYERACVLIEKPQYLAEHADRPSMLVDDKIFQVNQLPAHCTGVLINRMQKDRLVMHDGYYQVNTLEAVKGLLPS